MSNKCPKLNFPPCTFRVNDSESKLRIWDDLRGLWLVLTPEEWVRRHLIDYLLKHLGIPSALMAQECPVSVQGMPQRADVVVYRRDGRPLLLVECKASDVEVDATVYAQAVRYNAVLGAQFILLTNGMQHYVYEHIGDNEYMKLQSFPPLREFL